MLQSNILLTQTFVDEEKLQKYLAYSFYKKSTLKIDLSTDYEEVDISWNSFLAQNRVIVPLLFSKEDYKNKLFEFYQKYDSPTMLFLGNLKEYSLPMQEGMLRLLEEPPHNLYIILFSLTQNNILPAIKSRCSIGSVETSDIIKILDQNLLEKVKKKFPDVESYAKSLIHNRNIESFEEISKMEREEISFWIWQLKYYFEQVYLSQPSDLVASIITKILMAENFNQHNVQKKLLLSYLKV